MQFTSLLVILTGYGVLVFSNGLIASKVRRDRHSQTVFEAHRELMRAPVPRSAEDIQARLERVLSPGLLIWVETAAGVPYRTTQRENTFGLGPLGPLAKQLALIARGQNNPVWLQLSGGSFLFSTLPVRLGESGALLRYLEDFSSDVKRERNAQELLIAVAVLTALLTSGLMRLALDRGLSPLGRLSTRLEDVTLPTVNLSTEGLQVEEQPLELQQIAAAFNDLLGRLATSWERQTAFADGVAHELRTPITLISGYAQRLRRQIPASAPESRPLALIESESARMGRLVTDLLDIARDDAGRLDLALRELDLDQELLEAYERLSTYTTGRLRLIPSEEQEPLRAWGDADRLQQCLTNLVENALKHTPVGCPIELFADGNPREVVVHVRDQGPGVHPGDRRRIFERFVRGAPASGVPANLVGSGSGLGLSVVKLLMERMDGTARVAETPGGGADFQLKLRRINPRQPGDPPSA
ncbi:HAMP domain-containing histidine kinase [Synechococcus sp. ATX 2A4]|nr:HAMP domain-containing histidine kinase [Synechococcus sp. ATX 2A4]